MDPLREIYEAQKALTIHSYKVDFHKEELDKSPLSEKYNAALAQKIILADKVEKAINDYKGIASANPDTEYEYIKVVNKKTVTYDEDAALDYAIEAKDKELLSINKSVFKKEVLPAAKRLGIAVTETFAKQYQFLQKAFGDAWEAGTLFPEEEPKSDIPF